MANLPGIDDIRLGGVSSLLSKKGPEAVKAASKEMESLFAYEMIKVMRETVGGATKKKGMGAETYTSMFDMELSRIMADRGLGLQKTISRGLNALQQKADRGVTAADETRPSQPGDVRNPTE
jgi:Rod binding domain-containing protein